VSDTVDGTGFLTVQDLPAPSTPGRFTGEPVETTARLVARDPFAVGAVIVASGLFHSPWSEGYFHSQEASTLPRPEVYTER
jgi:hypothetical protein